MEARELALSQARGRIAVGAALVLFPGWGGRRWIGEPAGDPAVKLLTRALGVRDLAIGLGAVIALDRGAPARGWLEAGALSDVVDLVATLVAGDAIPAGARRAVTVIAAGSAVACAVLARTVDEPPVADVHAPEAELTGHH
jgi:hypothetical protein